MNNNTENCNLTMLFTDNIIRINVLFENIKSTNDKLYLKFDNSQLIDITANTVLNDKEYLSYNLYLINDRINQDKDIISFCKKIIQNKILKISFDKKMFYSLDISQFKSIIENIDFNNTLLEKYKNEILN